MVTRGEEQGKEELNKGGQKIQTSSCKISTRDVMYMKTTVNTAIWFYF